jgi:lipoprotein LprG
MREIARSAALLLAVVVLACSGPGAPAPNPTTVLRQAAQSMSGLHSVAADVKFGPGIVLQGLTLSSATTKVQLPGESDTILKVKQGDFLVDVRVVTSSGHVFLRLPFSQFTEVSADEARAVPDLSQLFDAKSGLPAVLPAGKDPKDLGTEQVGGVDTNKVSATYPADLIGQMLAGAVQPAGDIVATIWVDTTDHFVRRVILDGPFLEKGKDVRVQIDLHDFNQPVKVVTPTPTATP